jgi:hypothetical protein
MEISSRIGKGSCLVCFAINRRAEAERSSLGVVRRLRKILNQSPPGLDSFHCLFFSGNFDL